MRIAESILSYLEQTLPQYQFEITQLQRIGTSDPPHKFTIRFYRPHDQHGRIVIDGVMVKLQMLNQFAVHQFSLVEPDSILWIERFVAAGVGRCSIDLTQPLPAATGDCDDDWKREGDESLVY